MQRYTVVFIITDALHVSGGSSAHNQELKTAYTPSGICGTFLLLAAIVGGLELNTLAMHGPMNVKK